MWKFGESVELGVAFLEALGVLGSSGGGGGSGELGCFGPGAKGCSLRFGIVAFDFLPKLGSSLEG